MFNKQLLDELQSDVKADVALAVRTIKNSGVLEIAKQRVEAQVANAVLSGIAISPPEIEKYRGIWSTIRQFATLAQQIEEEMTRGSGSNPNA